jgi:hypothetical protein
MRNVERMDRWRIKKLPWYGLQKSVCWFGGGFCQIEQRCVEGTRKVLEIERVALFEMALVMCFWSTVEPFFFEIFVAGN